MAKIANKIRAFFIKLERNYNNLNYTVWASFFNCRGFETKIFPFQKSIIIISIIPTANIIAQSSIVIGDVESTDWKNGTYKATTRRIKLITVAPTRK